MPRGLSSAITARIAAENVRPVYLASFDFVAGTLRTWTGPGALSYDSQTWSSSAVVTQWPTITESVDLVASNASLELSGQYAYGFDLTDAAQYRARTCEVFIGLLESDGSLPSTNVYKIFSGRMAVVGLVQDGEQDAYSMQVESRLVDLAKAKAARYSHQTQLQRFAGDMGLEYAGAAQDSLFLSRGESPDQPFSRKVIYGTAPVPGSVVFVATSGSGSRYLNLVVAFADHECDGIDQLYLDGRAVLSGGSVAGEFVGVVDYYPHLGTDAQTYDTNLSTEVGGTVWGSTYRLRGICYVYLRILYSEELFGTEAPAVSALIRGKKLYDPRDASTAHSDNAALAIRDFLLSERYGFSGGAADVDDAALAVAANDCDYLVTKADAGTEKRYTVNGWLDTAVPIGQNLQQLLGALSGKLSYIAGVFALYAGNYALTSIVIGDGDLVGEIDFSNRNLRDAYNGARGLYRTPDLDWQEEDYPAYQNATAQTADGEERWIDLPLPLTTSAARCQRIAKIAVMRSRAARTLRLRVKLSQFDARAGDVISLNTAKTQVGAVAYEIRRLSLSMGIAPSLSLDLVEVAAADYAWDASTEEAELAVPEEPADSILAWTLARLTAPSGTPGSQTFNTGFNVTVTADEAGTTCYYTTDGTDPDEADSTVADGGTIAIGTSDTTLKLKTFQDVGSLTSDTVTYQYDYIAPTVYVPEPDYRWTWYVSSFTPDDNYPRLQYAVSALAETKLYNSENGGATWPLLEDGTSDGAFYTDITEILSSWTPSDYRAYATKVGYLDSNALIVADKCITPFIWKEDTEFTWPKKFGMQCFGTNCKIWYRSATKPKSGGDWSTWSSWSYKSSLGWADVIGTRYPNKTFEGEYTWYQYEVYVEQSGFSDSVVMFADSQTGKWHYGGESGVDLGFITAKWDGYSG